MGGVPEVSREDGFGVFVTTGPRRLGNEEAGMAAVAEVISLAKVFARAATRLVPGVEALEVRPGADVFYVTLGPPEKLMMRNLHTW